MMRKGGCCWVPVPHAGPCLCGWVAGTTTDVCAEFLPMGTAWKKAKWSLILKKRRKSNNNGSNNNNNPYKNNKASHHSGAQGSGALHTLVLGHGEEEKVETQWYATWWWWWSWWYPSQIPTQIDQPFCTPTGGMLHVLQCIFLIK